MELKDITSWLDIEAESLEDFQNKFKEKYFTESEVFADPSKLSKFTGKTLGSVTDNAVKIAKSFGVEVPKESIKDKKIEDIFNLILEQKEDQHQKLVEETKGMVSKGADEKFQELQSQLEKAQSKAKDLENLNKSTVNKYEEELKGWSGKVRQVKTDYAKTQLFEKVKYAPDLDPYKKKGFIASFDEKYGIDLDDSDNLFIFDKATGSRMEDPKKHGSFREPLDILQEEAVKAGVMSVNPQAGKPTNTPPAPRNMPPNYTPQGVPPAPTPIQGRKINPNAVV